MNGADSPSGRVASLHLHPLKGGEPFTRAETISLVAGKGIEGNPRYFDRGSRRQVTLIAREQIAAHANALGVERFEPGAVRSNIETEGVDLNALVDRDVRVGGAVLHIYTPRTPCHKMDALHNGLRALMENGRQGVLAQVVQSGVIR
ncbi:MAG: MOSC domain-containing protein, partial [Chloroflexi bacterium]|nr:MOSC domain-containing protein [Chloroflexota bacterium]